MRRGLMATAAVALAIGGCGGGSGDGDTSSAADAQAEMEQFQTCLADQGVDVPAPGAPPTGESGAEGTPPAGSPPKLSAKTQKALDACGQYMPSGSPPTGVRPGAPSAG